MTENLSIKAKSGREYKLLIAPPAAPAPSTGYPVLYVLDGNEYFELAAATAQIQAAALGPILVVGVGYPEDDPMAFIRRRYFDLTQPTPEALVEPQGMGLETGGAGEFGDLLREQVLPEIRQRYQTDLSRTAVFGHSLAGLFVLDFLYREPGVFSAYVATSPGVFWNNAALLEEEARFRKAQHLATSPRVLIAVGANEQTLDAAEERRVRRFLEQHPELSAGMSVEDAREMAARRRMVDHARGTAERLGSVLPVRYAEFESENHISVVPAALSRAVNFLTDES